ncbi:YqgE/AlgH family protein [Marinicella sp. W31]|uniref:YqgE/AlgH family protein n=1 Tax=Marinicella sp. W31 TaxID=3023713 RepID=UPI003757FAF3
MNSLTNQFLIALPDMQDDRFHHSLILICEHNKDGALGIVLNKPSDLQFGEVLNSLKIDCDDDGIMDEIAYEGGPVNKECGFVIHSGTAKFQSSIQISQQLALTTSRDIIEQIANNNLQRQWLFCLGCSSWSAGQLEQEILNNSWLTVSADTDLVFSNSDDKWEKGLALLGIQPHQLSGDFGHA